jgi:hypothetical protein
MHSGVLVTSSCSMASRDAATASKTVFPARRNADSVVTRRPAVGNNPSHWFVFCVH